MTTGGVHQVLASLSYGDAIGNEALVIQKVLRRAGYASDIFAEQVEPRRAAAARPLEDYEALVKAETVCLFHFSIGSAASNLAYHAPHRLVTIYHNVTPAASFAPFHPHLARLCHEGRQELAVFASRTELGLGDSEFNRRELEETGYSRTAVLPYLMDWSGYDAPASPVVGRLYPKDRVNVVFVGRVIPSKKIEDLLGAFAVYQRHYERRSRLLVVGDFRGQERYHRRLTERVAALRLRDVVFTGRVEDDDLRGYYQAADVFLGLSEHEGFCVPLLEAMHFGVPVMAYAAGAVEETLGGGGILLRDKAPDEIAALLDAVVRDAAFRRTVLTTQARALAARRAAEPGTTLLARLAPLLGATA